MARLVRCSSPKVYVQFFEIFVFDMKVDFTEHYAKSVKSFSLFLQVLLKIQLWEL
jgi:hypothetical protein